MYVDGRRNLPRMAPDCTHCQWHMEYSTEDSYVSGVCILVCPLETVVIVLDGCSRLDDSCDDGACRNDFFGLSWSTLPEGWFSFPIGSTRLQYVFNLLPGTWASSRKRLC